MKTHSNCTFRNVSLLLALILIHPTTHAAGDPNFIKFAISQSHQNNFYGCDTAISAIFENAGGADMRINSGAIPEIKNDTLRMTGIYGFKDDSVFVDATIRKVGKKCYTEETSMVHSIKSCVQYMKEYPKFKLLGETVGTTWARNNGGVLAIYHPVKDACVITYQKSRTF